MDFSDAGAHTRASEDVIGVAASPPFLGVSSRTFAGAAAPALSVSPDITVQQIERGPHQGRFAWRLAVPAVRRRGRTGPLARQGIAKERHLAEREACKALARHRGASHA